MSACCVLPLQVSRTATRRRAHHTMLHDPNAIFAMYACNAMQCNVCIEINAIHRDGESGHRPVYAKCNIAEVVEDDEDICLLHNEIEKVVMSQPPPHRDVAGVQCVMHKPSGRNVSSC